MAEPLRRFLGINGVAHNERHIAQHLSKYFEGIMAIIALCLPFYWYFSSFDEAHKILSIAFHWFIWITFVTEFVVLTSLVKNKGFYIKTNWLNLIIILFTFPLWNYISKILSILWLARLARILVLFRVLFSWWERQKIFLAKNHLYYTLIVFISVCLIAGASVSLFDNAIKDPFTGIWWAVQTITTVGYGDVIPQSLFGRCVAVLLMFMGVGLITILTANLSAYLLSLKEQENEEKQESDSEKLAHQLDEISSRLEKIEKKLKEFK